MIKAILFDLDGTLLPMGDLQGFVAAYLEQLCKKICPYGYQAEELTAGIWHGVGAMVKNDGGESNESRFWKALKGRLGEPIADLWPEFEAFYRNEFHLARSATGPNPLARRAVEAAGEKGRKVILATNPLFPRCAVETRLSWVELGYEDFDDVTTYETERFCKPNPAYFLAIAERHGLRPEECLMIGNDEGEDMYAATKAGMAGYLVTDCLIENKDHPWAGPRGSFGEMVEMLWALA